MEIVTENNFDGILASSKVVLVDFWASWCGPCRMLSPTVDDIAAAYEGKVTVAKCNVDDNEEIAAKYGIRNIPTLLYFKDGELAERSVGLVPRADIESILNNLL
ncbi:MAG: thioredoxin [Bacteroidales bacterium]|nr:thioredoxin [Bacteroidales bacterium]